MKLGLMLLAMAALAAAGDIAGNYTGHWNGAGGDGDFKIVLAQAGEKWNADVAFTFGGQDVKCKVTSVKVNGAQVELVYEFDLLTNRLESTATGEVQEKTFAGKYKTRALADNSPVDQGTFTTRSGS
jgi:hypothetical protein